MSVNRKLFLAIMFVLLIALVIALASGVALTLMGDPPKDAVKGGAFAFMGVATLGTGIVALFRFREGGMMAPPAQPPQGAPTP
ncbi:hypothetical protein [Streptomyces atroolivaceus]|uniref:hypothetical protein n=1 Tax=Streptomyces atroolivaceus TaxID=66869 RepID=UPI00202409F4|nr:hypothetical protein [Streptomyces atroolivaceus]